MFLDTMPEYSRKLDHGGKIQKEMPLFFLRFLLIWVTVSLYSLINSKCFKTEEYLAFSHALFMKLSKVKRRGNNKRLILCRRYSVLDF